MKGKELAIRLRDLIRETLDHHKHCEAARAAVANVQQLAVFHAWQAGTHLNKMKARVDHGNWQESVAAHVRGISESQNLYRFATGNRWRRIERSSPSITRTNSFSLIVFAFCIRRLIKGVEFQLSTTKSASSRFENCRSIYLNQVRGRPLNVAR